MRRSFRRSAMCFVLLFFLKNSSCYAYSLLTHLAIVDAAWENVIVTALKQKFPTVTEEQLKQARAFAYGGSITPDIGYAQHGNKLFSNLIHYVRAGDFFANLLLEAKDINEFAFALGALTHYYGDRYGHAIAVNRAVPLMFPKMQKRFGDTVTFENDAVTHSRTEFSFDVVQVARENYVSKAYHDFIGFQISKTILEIAFLKTYGLDVNELFGNFEKTVASLRWTVKDVLPQITRRAWKSNKKSIKEVSPAVTRHNFVYRMRKPDYFGEFGKLKEKTGVRATVLSFLFRIMPKIGKLKSFKFKIPTRKAQLYFTQSFDSSVINYSNGVKYFSSRNSFDNIDLDTGKKTAKYEYCLADKTYADWVIKLKEKKFEAVNQPLKENILAFFADYFSERTVGVEQCQQIIAALEELKTKGFTETK